MTFNCFIDNGSTLSLLAKNADGCRYLHFPNEIFPDFQYDFVLKSKIKFIGGVFNIHYGAIVFQETPKNLSLLCFQNNEITDQKTFESDILAVKVGQKRIITLLIDKFYIHNNINENIHQGRFELMPPNPTATSAYVISERLPYFAYPWYKSNTKQSSNKIHMIAILDIESEKIHLKIPATEPIVAIAFNATGARIAVADASGKELLIYDTENGSLLVACKCGSKKINIYSLVFSECEKFLISTSNKPTVQVFAVAFPRQPGESRIDKVDRLIELPLEESGYGSVVATKYLMDLKPDYERLRIRIVTATSRMHFFDIRTWSTTHFSPTIKKNTKLLFKHIFNILKVKFPIIKPFKALGVGDLEKCSNQSQ